MHLKRVDENTRTNVSKAIQCGKRGAREHRQYTAEYMCKYQYILASSIQVVSHDVMTAY